MSGTEAALKKAKSKIQKLNQKINQFKELLVGHRRTEQKQKAIQDELLAEKDQVTSFLCENNVKTLS